MSLRHKKTRVPSAVHGAGKVRVCPASVDGPAEEVTAEDRGEADLAAAAGAVAAVGGKCGSGPAGNHARHQGKVNQY